MIARAGTTRLRIWTSTVLVSLFSCCFFRGAVSFTHFAASPVFSPFSVPLKTPIPNKVGLQLRDRPTELRSSTSVLNPAVVDTLLPSNPNDSPILMELKERILDVPLLGVGIISSLRNAKESARKQMNPALYNALPWPETMRDYFNYLSDFLRWTPQQSGEEGFRIPGKDHDGFQEIYNRLCHFYYLIDGAGGTIIIQDLPWFRQWLVKFAQQWGQYLDTPESFNDDVLQSFIKYAPEYRVEDSMIPDFDRPGFYRPNMASGWRTFNQFFARSLNPGLRPISSPSDNTVVTTPADCTYREQFRINGHSCIDQIRVKGTHGVANINELLKGSGFENTFKNGKFVHYFLGPYSYHRFHTPVAGKVAYVGTVQAGVYLDVKISPNGQFDAPDNAVDGYEFNQARGILILDTKDSPCGNVGKVAVLPIGMCQVSSVQMTATPGSQLAKGEEFGYFAFGGSDMIVLFEEGVDAQIDSGGQYRHYGQPIASVKKLP